MQSPRPHWLANFGYDPDFADSLGEQEGGVGRSGKLESLSKYSFNTPLVREPQSSWADAPSVDEAEGATTLQMGELGTFVVRDGQHISLLA